MRGGGGGRGAFRGPGRFRGCGGGGVWGLEGDRGVAGDLKGTGAGWVRGCWDGHLGRGGGGRTY